MPWIDAGSVAVVVAHQFNPSIVSQAWLMKHGVLDKDGTIQDGSIFTDLLVQVRSSEFHMLLLPEQMQFVPVAPPEEQQKLLLEKVGTIIRELPHTPYRAVGLNFNWHLAPEDGDISRLTRELFCVADRPLYQRFGSSDARFGAYLSKDFAGFRLKLDIKPINTPLPGPPEHRLQFAFNFHCDLGEEPSPLLLAQLGRWDEVRQEAQGVIEAIRQGHKL